MKLGLIALITTVMLSSANAEEIRNLQVYKDSALISSHHSKIKMTDVRIEEVPKVIRIVPRACHTGSEGECTRAEVLEKIPVLQVTVQYRDGIFREENSYRTVDMEFNLPVSLLSEEQLNTLKQASRFSFSTRGRNIRKAFMKNHLNLEVKQITKPTQVIDEASSELCETDHHWERRPGCVEVRNYTTQMLKYQQIEISLK